jgi:hypothetical protein
MPGGIIVVSPPENVTDQSSKAQILERHRNQRPLARLPEDVEADGQLVAKVIALQQHRNYHRLAQGNSVVLGLEARVSRISL